MAGRYALVDFDSEGNVDTVYGDFTVNEQTGNPLLEAIDGNLVELGSDLDATENNISNVGVLGTDSSRIMQSGQVFDTSERYPQERTSPVRGTSPSIAPHPQADNPVLTASDVDDVAAEFVADPFVVWDDDSGMYYMFFEVMRDVSVSEPEDLGYASSDNGIDWTYEGLLTNDDSIHFAHPQAFKHAGEWYLIPTSYSGDASLDIYSFDPFPSNLVHDTTVVDNHPDYTRLADAVTFEIDGQWYCLSTASNENVEVIFTSESLLSGWQEHPESPIAHQTDKDQLVGRPHVHPDKSVLVWYLDTSGDVVGGLGVRPFRVDITPTTYTESPIGTNRVIEGTAESGDWRQNGMHHIDILPAESGASNIVAVDGRDGNNDWAIGIYTDGLQGEPNLTGLDLSNNPDTPTTFAQFNGSNWNPKISANDTVVVADNTVTKITDTSTGNGLANGLFVVMGRSRASSQNSFTDLLLVAGQNSQSVIDKHERSSTPRTYSKTNVATEIAIDDSGNTYDIGVWILGGWV